MSALPCPFCGHHEHLVEHAVRTKDGDDQILCDGCHAAGPLSEDIEGAVELWNGLDTDAVLEAWRIRARVDAARSGRRVLLVEEIRAIDAAWPMTGRAPEDVQLHRGVLVAELRTLIVAPLRSDAETAEPSDA